MTTNDWQHQQQIQTQQCRVSNLVTHLLEAKIWNRICVIEIDRQYQVASVVLDWGSGQFFWKYLQWTMRPMRKIVPRQIVGNLMLHRCSDWHGLIESSGAREKNFDVLGFRILTVTGGLADQSWWIAWVAFVSAVVHWTCAVVQWKLHDSSLKS